MTSFFSAQGGPIWIKFRRLEQNDTSTAVIWSKSKPDVEFQYGGRLGEFHCMSSQSHLPHCRVLLPGEFNGMSSQSRITLQGAATWWIHCHESRATCHITGCNNSIRHMKIVFRHILFYFCFFSTVLALTSGGFRIVSDTLVRFIIILQMQENRPGCLYNGPNGCITQCIRPEFCQLKQHSSTSCISSAGIPVYAY